MRARFSHSGRTHATGHAFLSLPGNNIDITAATMRAPAETNNGR
jgi:hypothetical protein